MPQLGVRTPQLKIPHAAAGTQHSQINKYFLKKNVGLQAMHLYSGVPDHIWRSGLQLWGPPDNSSRCGSIYQSQVPSPRKGTGTRTSQGSLQTSP